MTTDSFTTVPIPRYGMHMTYEDFITDYEDGIISLDSGYGYYATDTEMSDIEFKSETTFPEVFTHIWWCAE